MPNWTTEQLAGHKNFGKLVLKNDDAKNNRAGPVAKLESNSGDGALGAQKIQRPTGERFLMRITSIRKRLLDEDNLCGKYICDLFRYAGIVPDDSPDKLKIAVGQRKAQKGEREQTEIEVLKL
jgi:hypothetical protein